MVSEVTQTAYYAACLVLASATANLAHAGRAAFLVVGAALLPLGIFLRWGRMWERPSRVALVATIISTVKFAALCSLSRIGSVWAIPVFLQLSEIVIILLRHGVSGQKPSSDHIQSVCLFALSAVQSLPRDASVHVPTVLAGLTFTAARVLSSVISVKRVTAVNSSNVGLKALVVGSVLFLVGLFTGDLEKLLSFTNEQYPNVASLIVLSVLTFVLNHSVRRKDFARLAIQGISLGVLITVGAVSRARRIVAAMFFICGIIAAASPVIPSILSNSYVKQSLPLLIAGVFYFSGLIFYSASAGKVDEVVVELPPKPSRYFDVDFSNHNADRYWLAAFKGGDVARSHLFSESNLAYKSGYHWTGGEIATERGPPALRAPNDVLQAVKKLDPQPQGASVKGEYRVVVANPKRKYNPLYVYDGGGVRPSMLPMPSSDWESLDYPTTCLGEPCVVLPGAIDHAKANSTLDPERNRTIVMTTLFGDKIKWVWPLIVWSRAWRETGVPGSDVLVLVTPEVSQEARDLLVKYGVPVREVEPFDTGRWPDFQRRFDDTRWTGIYCRVLAHDIARDLGYHYMIFADADAIPLFDTSHVLKLLETRDNPARWMAQVRATQRRDIPMRTYINNGLAFFQIQPKHSFTRQFEWWIDDVVRSVGPDVIPNMVTASEQDIYSEMFFSQIMYLPLSYNYRTITDDGRHAPEGIVRSKVTRSALKAAGITPYWTNLPPAVVHFNADLKPWMREERDFMRDSADFCNGKWDRQVRRWEHLDANEFYGEIQWFEYICVWGRLSRKCYDAIEEEDIDVIDSIIDQLWKFEY